ITQSHKLMADSKIDLQSFTPDTSLTMQMQMDNEVNNLANSAMGILSAQQQQTGSDSHRYRQYIESKMDSATVKDDPLLKEMISYPEDDVQSLVVPQQHRTREATLHYGAEGDTLRETDLRVPPYIQQAIKTYRDPRRTIQRRYQRFKKDPERLVQFENDKYDCDIDVDRRRSIMSAATTSTSDRDESVDTENELLRCPDDEAATDAHNKENRSKGRLGFLRYFRPDYNWGSGMELSICNRGSQDMWTKPRVLNVLIELQSLAFVVGELEPFFCSLHLYDAATKCRLTENFYFDFNNDKHRQLLSKYTDINDPATGLGAKHVVVSLPARQQNDIWIVVRVDKVLQGDPDEARQPYLRLEENLKEVKKSKLKQTDDVVKKFCERLGAHRQMFSAAAIPLTGEAGDVKHGVFECDYLLKQVPKTNSDLDDLISELKDPSKRKKLRTLQGTLTIKIHKPADELPRHTLLLDPSLNEVISKDPLNAHLAPSQPLITTSLTASSSSNQISSSTSSGDISRLAASGEAAVIPVIRELHTFAAKKDQLPYSSYVNNLYIYPDIINLTKAHGRNVFVKVELRESDMLTSRSLAVFYGKTGGSLNLTNRFLTQTHYHDKTPTYVDEIKVRLPFALSTKHHLLFKLYHVVCNKKKDEDTENLIGFSVLPIYKDRRIIQDGLQNLPLALSEPTDRYLRDFDDHPTMLESGRPLFKLNMVLNSSVFPQNTHLNKFLLLSGDQSVTDNEINQMLNDFSDVDAAEAIRFLPVIFQQMILVICNRDTTVGINGIKAIFMLLAKVQAHLGESNCRVPLLVSYVSHVYVNPKGTKVPVYSALCSRLLFYLMFRKNGKQVDKVSNGMLFSFSWFIYDLIIKSLALSLLDDTPDVLPGNREGKYDADFNKYLPKLVTFVLHNINASMHSDAPPSRLESEANNSLSLFVRDLFTVYDRGTTVDMAFMYINEINAHTAQAKDGRRTTLLFYKFDFLKVLTDYEHYVNVNLPIPHSISNIQNITNKFSSLHPLSGLLIGEVMDALYSNTTEVRMVALTTLGTILIKHEYDVRYLNQKKRERLASTYLLLIMRLIDEYERFKVWYNVAGHDERRMLIASVLFIIKNLSRVQLKQWISKEMPQRINILFELLKYCARAFEYSAATQKATVIIQQQMAMQHQGSANTTPINSPSIQAQQEQSSSSSSSSERSSGGLPLSSITKLLKKGSSSSSKDKGGSLAASTMNLGTSGGMTPHSNDPMSQSLPLGTSATSLNQSALQALLVAASNQQREQRDRESTSGSSTPLNTSGGVPPPMQQLPSSNTSPNVSGYFQSLGDLSRQVSRSPSVSRTRSSSPNDHTLCAEANLVILDFVEDYIVLFRASLADSTSSTMPAVYSLILTLLKLKQSHRVISALLATLHSFVFKFRGHLFNGNNQFAGHLCKYILLYCSSVTRSVMTDATAFFYSLFRLNNQEVGNIGRIKIQATIALSNQVTDGRFVTEESLLEQSLSNLACYASHEVGLPNHAPLISTARLATMSSAEIKQAKERFHQQITSMSTKLIKILRDTAKINKTKKRADPETVHELYSKIASGYSDTPIIRVDWLEELADIHISQENYFEAGVCRIRIALLINAYLHQNNLLPCKLDLSLILQINPDLNEIVVEEDEGVCTSTKFSIKGLQSAIYSAMNDFRNAECFEFSILLYKLMVPLCEATRDYKELASIYKEMHELYNQIVKAEENKSRLLGRYYRVGFYGKKFEELDGVEFVYKEPKLTHLFALADRLKTFYKERLGEMVTVFPDSNRVNRSTLEPDKLYLQITSVKPYFEREQARPTYFDRHTNLNKFVFITPFTLSGKTQGSITEQFHRKSIITIEGTAPSMLKRYPIIGYKEIEISPIENSIETIQERSRLLAMENNKQPPNIKTLQGVLQGSVLLQVNAGALEVCRGFLARSNRANWPEQSIRELESRCTEFLKQCKRALQLNKTLIKMDQIAFQNELENGYKRLSFKMEKYIRGEINESEEAELPDVSVIEEEDDESLLTEESYDELSIKESSSSISSSSSILPNFLKRNSNQLTVREERTGRSRRGSREFDVPP
ncbi:hypothetical protein SAMD00019534_020970, partial [Acytostelium subglobosum LB1]|uniref:hypothetical protein n=1 Tax=Acytostelium subglobosum LB1 TaxID=1410327 RepID=UPI0006451188